ncbi:hypothetical protein [Streptomyces niveus]|uniref:hypothetical protein n=1 Tax=Streptomyces niveus TaxID=193462 RepID=UPI00341E42EF
MPGQSRHQGFVEGLFLPAQIELEEFQRRVNDLYHQLCAGDTGALGIGADDRGDQGLQDSPPDHARRVVAMAGVIDRGMTIV